MSGRQQGRADDVDKCTVSLVLTFVLAYLYLYCGLYYAAESALALALVLSYFRMHRSLTFTRGRPLFKLPTAH